MQFSQNSFGAQKAIKEMYRQYSTTFKPTSDLIKNMTQSSNLPFNKMYQAFNSSSKMNNFGLEQFKHSQAQSIIEKLMQTQDVKDNPAEEEALIFNELNNIKLDHEHPKKGITLGNTETKIFREIINIISQIEDINQQAYQENQDLCQLKGQMIEVGLEFPEIEESNSKGINFNIYSPQELEILFEQTQRLEEEIQTVTKKLTNRQNPDQTQQRQFEFVLKKNRKLNKQLFDIKQQIFSTGQIGQEEFLKTEQSIRDLEREIADLQRRRWNKLFEGDQELVDLKRRNQELREKTIGILSAYSQPKSALARRKQQLIQKLQSEQKERQEFQKQIQNLKQYYVSLKQENQLLKRGKTIGNHNYQSSKRHFDSRLQVESNVRPFGISDLERNSFNFYSNSLKGKQNFYQNYEPTNRDKTSKTPYLGQSFGSKKIGYINEQSSYKLSQYQDSVGKMRSFLN